MECLLPYSGMVTVPNIMVGLERMLDYRGVGLVRFHCTQIASTRFQTFDCRNPIHTTTHRVGFTAD